MVSKSRPLLAGPKVILRFLRGAVAEAGELKGTQQGGQPTHHCDTDVSSWGRLEALQGCNSSHQPSSELGPGRRKVQLLQVLWGLGQCPLLVLFTLLPEKNRVVSTPAQNFENKKYVYLVHQLIIFC